MKEFKHFEVKAIGEGKLSGRASPFGGGPDSYGDVIAEHAYDDWMARTGGNVLITVDHNLAKTVGKGIARVGVGGLDVAITLSMDLQDAKDAFIRARDGLAQQLSIGYETKRASFRKDGVRVLEQIELFEISLVPLGAAGDRAQLTSVKQRDDAIHTVLDAVERNIKAWKDEIAVKDTVSMLFALSDAEFQIRRINQTIKEGF